MRVLVDIMAGLERISILADDTENRFKVNGKDVNFDIDRFIFRTCDITMNWPEKLINQDIIDGNKVKVIIKNDTAIKEMKFINKLPKNYHKFQALIDEVLDVEKRLSRNS